MALLPVSARAYYSLELKVIIFQFTRYIGYLILGITYIFSFVL